MTAQASSAVSRWVRQAHRWLSVAFTLTVIANFVAMTIGTPPAWIVYSPLPFLFLMLLTGLYMFVLPYTDKGRAIRAGE
jgi:ribose/xylose/arabinose/galactoside ABC-type transport system permease subunit